MLRRKAAASPRHVVIIGAGGSARDIADVFDAASETNSAFEVIGYVADPQYATQGDIINNRPVLGGFDWLEANAAKVEAVCAVGAPEIRRQLVLRARAVGARFCSVVHPSVIRSQWVEIGEGTVISGGCILTNRIRIGSHVQINVACTLTHDGVIGDFATLSPGVRLSGNVSTGEGCFLGTGACVIERRSLGAWSVVGAGCTVINDVPPNATVVGVPGRTIRIRESGWHL